MSPHKRDCPCITCQLRQTLREDNARYGRLTPEESETYLNMSTMISAPTEEALEKGLRWVDAHFARVAARMELRFMNADYTAGFRSHDYLVPQGCALAPLAREARRLLRASDLGTGYVVTYALPKEGYFIVKENKAHE